MKKIYIVLLIMILVVVGAISSSVYFYTQYSDLRNNPDKLNEERVKDITSKISKFMDVPSDEEPTITTITDATKTNGIAFSSKAQNGDIVVVYSKEGKAILYRPSTNKVIDFALVDKGSVAGAMASPTPAPTAIPTPPPTPIPSPSLSPTPTPTATLSTPIVTPVPAATPKAAQ